MAPSRDKIREIVFGLPAAEKKSISSHSAHLQPSTTPWSPPPAPLASGKDAGTPPDVASGRHRGSLSVCQTAIKQKQKAKASISDHSEKRLFIAVKCGFFSAIYIYILKSLIISISTTRFSLDFIISAVFYLP